MKKILLSASFLTILVVPSFSSAATVEELKAQIDALMAQLQQLQDQLAQLQGGSAAWCHDFNTNLKIGDSGSEVSALQTALEKENFSISASEKSSDLFDESTASAVTGFQEKYKSEILTPIGLSHGTGYVGAKTREKLNKIYGCTGNGSSVSSIILSRTSPDSSTKGDYLNPWKVGDITTYTAVLNPASLKDEKFNLYQYASGTVNPAPYQSGKTMAELGAICSNGVCSAEGAWIKEYLCDRHGLTGKAQIIDKVELSNDTSVSSSFSWWADCSTVSPTPSPAPTPSSTLTPLVDIKAGESDKYGRSLYVEWVSSDAAYCRGAGTSWEGSNYGKWGGATSLPTSGTEFFSFSNNPSFIGTVSFMIQCFTADAVKSAFDAVYMTISPTPSPTPTPTPTPTPGVTPSPTPTPTPTPSATSGTITVKRTSSADSTRGTYSNPWRVGDETTLEVTISSELLNNQFDFYQNSMARALMGGFHIPYMSDKSVSDLSAMSGTTCANSGTSKVCKIKTTWTYDSMCVKHVATTLTQMVDSIEVSGQETPVAGSTTWYADCIGEKVWLGRYSPPIIDSSGNLYTPEKGIESNPWLVGDETIFQAGFNPQELKNEPVNLYQYAKGATNPAPLVSNTKVENIAGVSCTRQGPYSLCTLQSKWESAHLCERHNLDGKAIIVDKIELANKKSIYASVEWYADCTNVASQSSSTSQMASTLNSLKNILNDLLSKLKNL